MAIKGNLKTMTLQDLFHWVVDHSETGVLELERQKVRKRIAFRDGRIVGCSSDDPPSRIGQFLLARGKISKEALAKALEFQKGKKQTLGSILQDMGEIEAEEFAYELSAKAEENLLSLFDWQQAVFEFHPGQCDDPWMLDVNMSVEAVLERGTTRRDQLSAIRRLFASSGVILRRTDVQVPAAIRSNALAQRILGATDGERTIGEICLHARASEFLVLKFLASAVHSELLSIMEIRSIDPSVSTLLDQAVYTPAEPARPEGEEFEELAVPAPTPEFEEQIELAQHFLAQDEIEAALQILDDCYQQRPGSEFLRHLMGKAEATFIKNCRERDLPAEATPLRIEGSDLCADDGRFSVADRFLLGLIDEGHSIQTLMWIAPMREIDVYRALTRMRGSALIRLKEPSPATDEVGELATIHWA
jgi:hypothetical protein